MTADATAPICDARSQLGRRAGHYYLAQASLATGEYRETAANSKHAAYFGVDLGYHFTLRHRIAGARNRKLRDIAQAP